MAPYIDDVSSPTPAAGAQPVNGPAGGDEFDDLFDYDAGLDDVFRDLEPRKPTSPKDASRKGRADLGLGIDKEVDVVKRARVPRVKLDENRLLSQAGIPRLRKKAKDLKFKGKGHEYSDAARLLSFYQLWLDDLFPKAKFLDAAAMVEKLGHKKRIQMMRMDWINEGKPKEPVQEDSIFDEPMLPPREVSDRNNAPPRVAPIFEKSRIERPKTPDVNEDSEEDPYGATPRDSQMKVNELPVRDAENESLFGPKKMAVRDELADDLDALLAEQEMEEMSARNGSGLKSEGRSMRSPEPDFDDEMEAMLEMEAMVEMEAMAEMEVLYDY